jgi:hypothetical protein
MCFKCGNSIENFAFEVGKTCNSTVLGRIILVAGNKLTPTWTDVCGMESASHVQVELNVIATAALTYTWPHSKAACYPLAC